MEVACSSETSVPLNQSVKSLIPVSLVADVLSSSLFAQLSDCSVILGEAEMPRRVFVLERGSVALTSSEGPPYGIQRICVAVWGGGYWVRDRGTDRRT